MDKEIITEGKAKIAIYPGNVKKSDKVFYNPEMRINRDIAVLAINAFTHAYSRDVRVLDVMSASGIRGIRYALECSRVKEVVFNDLNPHALELIKENITRNDIKNAIVFNKDAAELMHHYRFEGDVVDVDPFGSAAYYLEALARCTSNKGMFMITFTDTAVLSGTYPRTALRRYGVEHSKEYFPKGEIALRVAWKSVAESFAKFDKGIKPLLSISHKHYIRLIGMVDKHKHKAEENIKNLKYLCFEENQKKHFSTTPCEKYIGRVWCKQLGDNKFVESMLNYANNTISNKTIALLNKLKEEYSIQGTYYELPKIASYYKKTLTSIEELKEKIKPYKLAKAHFKGNVVITNAPYEKIVDALSTP